MEEQKIEKAVIAAKDKLIELGIEEALISEIEWCLGSYAFDHNPQGLIEKAQDAHQVLSKYKKKNTRKVAKKILDDLQKAMNSN